ncbi:MAG: dephospho-CoA kinase [Saprospiraceae bacterium]|nr:dephospho-CoA kinase [Saprospiraceae bacterium]
MLKVAITGGIGTGKTTVANIFQILGIPVYFSDRAAKALMHTDPELIAAIQQHFGSEAYESGRLNRAFLSEQVFQDPAKLDLLNSLVHPAVFRDQARWIGEQSAPYVLFESAIIYEIKRANAFDAVIVVDAPEELRISRVMSRDSVDESAIRQRMAAQLPQQQKVEQADIVIHNNGKDSLIKQALEVHQLLVAQNR